MLRRDGIPAIAHLSFSGDFGGREKVAATLQKGMRECGYDSFLYMIVEERLGPERNANLLRCLGEADRSRRLFRTAARFSPKLLFELRDALRSDAVGVIHCHCYKSLFYAHLMRKLGMVRAAVFYTLHGLVLRPGWKSRLILATQDIGLRLCDGVIGCSREILASSLPAGWRGASAVIVNAVESPFDAYGEVAGRRAAARRELVERYGLNPDAPIVINVGRLCPQKNFPLYLRLIERLAAGEDSPPASFLLLGNGALETALKAEADRLGVREKVVFTGFVPEMDRVFTGADLLVQTSTWEGTPMCLLEAQSYGLPAVVPAVGGNGDVLVDGRDGFLYPVNDLDRLAERTVEYLRDAGLRERHGREAFDKVRRDAGLPGWVEQHAAFYQRVLDGKNGGRGWRHA